jgi:hypothetical protein
MPGRKKNSHARRINGQPKRLRPGQPDLGCKLDDRLEAQFCDHVRTGLPVEACCALVRISKQTFYSWKNRGEVEAESGENTRYAEFAKNVETANAEAMQTLHDQARKTNPLWVLERRWPQHYGAPKMRVETELSGSLETRGELKHQITFSCSDEPGLMDLLRNIPLVDADGQPITGQEREDILHGRNGNSGENGSRP